MPPRLAKRLVARAALLTVPDRLVDNGYRGENRNLLEAKDEMSQVGDRAVTILEVERIQELFRSLRAQLLDCLEHALAGAGVLGQSIGLNLGWDARDGID